ncbi:MAG: nucleotide exchange factor GrpE [Spirochaetaceae bacterium]|nr:nucleotide exchange factor GrpE [Spirochaetaceae bacterium]
MPSPEDSPSVQEDTADMDQAVPEAGASECLSSEEKLADLEAKLAEAKDQYLRKAADFENFRKRMNREKQEAIEFANQALLLELIPIIDDFERAIKSAESAASSSQDFKNLYEGIAMIEKRLVSQLENKWGLRRFDSAGEVFDPNRHEAIMVEKSTDITEPVVQEDLIKGYILKDRIVRSAKVKVLMPENPAPEACGEGGAENNPAPESGPAGSGGESAECAKGCPDG